MSKTRVKAGVMVAAMFCTSLALAEDGAESVTVKLSGGSTAVGVGANWGDGGYFTMTWDLWDYLLQHDGDVTTATAHPRKKR